MKKKDKTIWDIVILSPHMDDAVLSLGQHIVNWRKEGKKIKIITVFTKFGDGKSLLEEYSKKYIESSGIKSVSDFEKRRKEEDNKVMCQLKVDYEYWNYTDAGFRGIYMTRRKLLGGKISLRDKDLLNKIKKRIGGVRTNLWLVPYGVGGHVDHLIVKRAGERVNKINKLFYLESPYLWEKFNFLEIVKNIFKTKSLLVKVGNKNKLLKGYVSQYRLWGDYKLPYMEIIVKC